MYNFGDLNDVEFEYLCKDVMSSVLGIELRRFAVGRDGGIDLRSADGSIVVQVKHYIKSSVASLTAALKDEVPKVKKLAPKQYYVCCSKELSSQKIDEIYRMFSDRMSSSDNVITLTDISDFLDKPENADILKKHYKLWINSTGVLESVFTGDVDMDCATAFADIENDVRFFVKTRAFDRALKCLNDNRTLMIVGEPGIGKTTTSKMLALYFLKNKYRLRYTTDGMNLGELKKSLSRDRDAREVILLDDCFGQAYFNMKETQGNELGALIAHVGMCKNKVLILNSRVTIYGEAKRRTPELIKCINNGRCKLYVLDMSDISALDKAQILYNHLYFNELPPEYLSEIKKDKRYRKIIEHRNYSPRIIEFVSDKTRAKSVAPKDFYKFVMRNLDNPSEVWRNEYEERISEIDRMLLTTLYSLTSTTADYGMLKRCFGRRLQKRKDVDMSVDHFKLSLARLEQSFVSIVDMRGKKCVSVVNPSVNDFLDAYFAENEAGRAALVSDCVSVAQYGRLLREGEYEEKMFEAFLSRAALGFEYENESQKCLDIAYGVAMTGAKDKEYAPYVQDYVMARYKEISFEHINDHSYERILSLLKPELAEFYGLKELLTTDNGFGDLLESYELKGQLKIINAIDYMFAGEDRERYIETIAAHLEYAIYDYSSSSLASDFFIDIGSIIKRSYFEDSEGDEYFDEDTAVKEIEDEMWEDVTEQLESWLSELPQDIRAARKYQDFVQIDAYDAEDLINGYFSDLDNKYNYQSDGADDETDEIDRIFNAEH